MPIFGGITRDPILSGANADNTYFEGTSNIWGAGTVAQLCYCQYHGYTQSISALVSWDFFVTGLNTYLYSIIPMELDGNTPDNHKNTEARYDNSTNAPEPFGWPPGHPVYGLEFDSNNVTNFPQTLHIYCTCTVDTKAWFDLHNMVFFARGK